MLIAYNAKVKTTISDLVQLADLHFNQVAEFCDENKMLKMRYFKSRADLLQLLETLKISLTKRPIVVHLMLKSICYASLSL